MKEVVISISDQLYENIKESKACGKHGVVRCDLLDAVADGVVLPAGHGDLIDKQELIQVLNDTVLFNESDAQENVYGLNIAIDRTMYADAIVKTDVGDK